MSRGRTCSVYVGGNGLGLTLKYHCTKRLWSRLPMNRRRARHFTKHILSLYSARAPANARTITGPYVSVGAIELQVRSRQFLLEKITFMTHDPASACRILSRKGQLQRSGVTSRPPVVFEVLKRSMPLRPTTKDSLPKGWLSSHSPRDAAGETTVTGSSWCDRGKNGHRPYSSLGRTLSSNSDKSTTPGKPSTGR